MPKKTKSQKIIAELKRKLATQATRKVIPQEEKQTEKPSETENRPRSEIQSKTEEENISSSFILNDLKKSLFLTILAISLEFVLYYFWGVGGIDKMRPLINNFKKFKIVKNF